MFLMIKDFSYGIVPIYKSNEGLIEVLIVKWVGYRWFPKWHIEKDETPVDTARREFMEEVWISEVIIDEENMFKDHYIFSHKKNVIDKFVWYFVGYVSNKKVIIDRNELSDFRWLSVSKARDKLTYDNGKKLLDEVMEYIKGK